jgi:hypothetical protein
MKYAKTVLFRLVLPSIIALIIWWLAGFNMRLSDPLSVLLNIEGTLLLAFAISFPPGPNRLKWFFASMNFGSTPSISYPNFYLGLAFLVSGILVAAGFPVRGISANEGFVMKDNLMCTVESSSERDDRGSRISLLGIKGPAPKVLYESGVTSPMKTLWESDTSITIQLVAGGTGSVDTIVVDKTTGKFSRATAGSLVGVYSSPQQGRCR